MFLLLGPSGKSLVVLTKESKFCPLVTKRELSGLSEKSFDTLVPGGLDTPVLMGPFATPTLGTSHLKVQVLKKGSPGSSTL